MCESIRLSDSRIPILTKLNRALPHFCPTNRTKMETTAPILTFLPKRVVKAYKNSLAGFAQLFGMAHDPVADDLERTWSNGLFDFCVLRRRARLTRLEEMVQLG